MSINTFSHFPESMHTQTAGIVGSAVGVPRLTPQNYVLSAFVCATFALPAVHGFDTPPTLAAHLNDIYVQVGSPSATAKLAIELRMIGEDLESYFKSHLDVQDALTSLQRTLRGQHEIAQIDIQLHESPEDGEVILVASIRCYHENWEYFDKIDDEIISAWLNGQSEAVLSRVAVTIGAALNHGTV